MEFSGAFEIVVAAQLIAGAAWGCILMSAFSAAAALGYTGAEGKTTGVLFSALALATFTRMATTASGALNDPSLAPLLHWAPVVCWAIGGRQQLVDAVSDNRSAKKIDERGPGIGQHVQTHMAVHRRARQRYAFQSTPKSHPIAV